MKILKSTLKSVKTKAGIAAMSGALLVAPGGIALAHGSHSDDGRYRNYSYSSYSKYHRHSSHRHHSSNNDTEKTCDERQAAANQKVFDYKAKAQAKFDGLSAYLSNQEAFVENNDNINIDKYEELKQKAEDAKTKANDALNNVSAPNIDCDKSERNDKRAVYAEVYKLHKSLERFENKVQKLSVQIANNVSINS